MPTEQEAREKAFNTGWDAAIAACQRIAVERSVACQQSARAMKQRYPDNTADHRYWWASEICAQREADHISREIKKLTRTP